MLNLRIIFFFLGILITTLGISMLVPFLFEVYNSANNIKTFISCSFFTLLVGISILIAFRTEEKKSLTRLALLSLGWGIGLDRFYEGRTKDGILSIIVPRNKDAKSTKKIEINQ